MWPVFVHHFIQYFLAESGGSHRFAERGVFRGRHIAWRGAPAALVGAPLELRPLGAFLVVTAPLFLEVACKRMPRALLYLGDVSYSTYLLHGSARTLWHGATLLVFTAAHTAALSHLSYRYIERNRMLGFLHQRALRRLSGIRSAEAR